MVVRGGNNSSGLAFLPCLPIAWTISFSFPQEPRTPAYNYLSHARFLLKQASNIDLKQKNRLHLEPHGTMAGTEGKPSATSSEEPMCGDIQNADPNSTCGVFQNLEYGCYVCPANGFQLALLPMFKTCRISGALAASLAAET
jgi:hypothetical protein